MPNPDGTPTPDEIKETIARLGASTSKPNEVKNRLLSELSSLGINPDALNDIKQRINDLFLGTSTAEQQQPIYDSLMGDGSLRAYVEEANAKQERRRFDRDYKAWVNEIPTRAEARLGRGLSRTESVYIAYVQNQLRVDQEDNWEAFTTWRDVAVTNQLYGIEELADTSTASFISTFGQKLILDKLPEDQRDDILATMAVSAADDSAEEALALGLQQATWRKDAQAEITRAIKRVEGQLPKALTEEQRDAYLETYQDLIDDQDKIADEYVKNGAPAGISVQEFVSGRAGAVLQGRFAGTAYAGAVNPQDFIGSIGGLTTAFKAERDAAAKAETERKKAEQEATREQEKIEQEKLAKDRAVQGEIAPWFDRQLRELEETANDENEDEETRTMAATEAGRMRQTRESFIKAYAERPNKTEGPEEFLKQSFGTPITQIRQRVEQAGQRRDAARTSAIAKFGGRTLDLGDQRQTTAGEALQDFDLRGLFPSGAGAKTMPFASVESIFAGDETASSITAQLRQRGTLKPKPPVPEGTPLDAIPFRGGEDEYVPFDENVTPEQAREFAAGVGADLARHRQNLAATQAAGEQQAAIAAGQRATQEAEEERKRQGVRTRVRRR